MKFLLLFLFSIIFIGCNNQPVKPANVPSDAFFVGGPDGGVFLKCRKNMSKPNTYQCSIYSDSNGEIWSEGVFAITNSGNTDFDVNDKGIYSYWDGRFLCLKDRRCLAKVSELQQS